MQTHLTISLNDVILELQIIVKRYHKLRSDIMPRKSLQTLSEPMYYVLLALTKELYGTEIMNEVRRISGGRINIGPGTLYTMLDKFASNELITRTNHSLSTKSYIITDEGKKMLKEEYKRISILLHDGQEIVEGL